MCPCESPRGTYTALLTKSWWLVFLNLMYCLYQHVDVLSLPVICCLWTPLMAVCESCAFSLETSLKYDLNKVSKTVFLLWTAWYKGSTLGSDVTHSSLEGSSASVPFCCCCMHSTERMVPGLCQPPSCPDLEWGNEEGERLPWPWACQPDKL